METNNELKNTAISVVKPRKGRTLARRLEKFYSTEAAKDKKKALEELTADERKFLLMSHAVGEDRVTSRIMTILVAGTLLMGITSLLPNFNIPLPYPYANIIYAAMFALWIVSILTTLIVGAIYLGPILSGKFRQMANTIGSTKILEADNLISEEQADNMRKSQEDGSLFSKLAVSLTDRLASGLSLKKIQVQVKQAKTRGDTEDLK